MAKIIVPPFLQKVDAEIKPKMIKQHKIWKNWDCNELLIKYLEDELEALVRQDELDSFSSYFETKWAKAKRLGKRDAIRSLLKNLK